MKRLTFLTDSLAFAHFSSHLSTHFFSLCTLLCILWAPATAFAQEDGSRRPMTAGEATSGTLLLQQRGPSMAFYEAPRVSSNVRIEVTGLIARATVEQVFENPTDQVVEAVYVFPLPETAAVDGLKMQIGERIIEGEIKEREEARRTYEAAVRQGKKASLVEQERPNLFTTSAGNIGPKEKIHVRITYQQEVRYDTGRFSLVFPATMTPRYIPGTSKVTGFSGNGWGVNTNQVPDAARITPPIAPKDHAPTLSLHVELDAGFPLLDIKSGSHNLTVTRNGKDKASLELAAGTVVADRDFTLQWEPEPSAAPTAAMFVEQFQGERYALLMLLPPDPKQDASGRLPKETTFVIDTSGSMSGTSIEQAQSSLLSGLGTLQATDMFQVIEFNSTTSALFNAPVPADASHVQQARDWVNGLAADGGTEMLPALKAALRGAAGENRVQQLVFITDGSVGDEPEIFQFIVDKLKNQRLFTVGIGSAPNRYFMSGAARFGRGTFTHIASLSDVSTKMGELWTKLDAPVMTELKLNWKGQKALDVWPSRVPDLYRGEPLMVVAKLPAKTSDLELKGKRAGQAFAATMQLTGGSTERGVHRLWAKRKIDGLMDQLVMGKTEEQIRPDVIKLALHHHLVSRYTSLVAVDKTKTVNAPAHTMAVPVAMPDGNTMLGNMPQTATPMQFLLWLGTVLLGAAIWLGTLGAGRGRKHA